MQCNKLHQGFTSHDTRLHFSLTNEYLSSSEMRKHSKPLWAKFFPLLRSMFWGLMVLGGGGFSWGASSFLRACVHYKFSYLESGGHASSQVFEAGVWETSVAIFPSTAWSSEVARHWQAKAPSVPNNFISFADPVTSPPMTGPQNICVQKKVSSVVPVSANKKTNVNGTMQTKQREEPGRELTLISLSLCLGGLHHKIHICKYFCWIICLAWWHICVQKYIHMYLVQ